MNNQIKIEHYNILNGIKMDYLKTHEPFNFIKDISTQQSNIKLTYNDIFLTYLKNKKYFVAVDKQQFNRGNKQKWSQNKQFNRGNKQKWSQNKQFNRGNKQKWSQNKQFNRGNKLGGELSTITVFC
jgi:hypothetical protein